VIDEAHSVPRIREALDRRLDPPTLTFPADWRMSGSWERAVRSPGDVGSVNPAQYDVLLGYPDRDERGDRHRVTFAIYGGDLVAECDCSGWNWNEWCAHVARLWWLWVRGKITVSDLDTARRHPHPPAWLRVEDQTADVDHRARADGGERR
jgi:hypothetical protein